MSSGHLRQSSRGSSKKKDDGYHYSQGAQVQNVKKSRVYVFGDADVQDDDVVEFEMSEVRSRKGGPKPIDPEEKEPLYFEREITEGDSLQGLSLQYGCPMAELKRVNNMMKDQDFYGRRILKIPIKRHSFMTELISQQNEEKCKKLVKNKKLENGMTMIDETRINGHQERLMSDDTDNESSCNLSDPETQNLIIRTLSIKDAVSSQSREAEEFLNNMDKDLSKIRQSAMTERRSLDEVVSLLTNRNIRPFPPPKKTSGADCGIRWRTIVIIMLLIAIAIPTAFYLLFKYYDRL